jgi:glycosyltransferase 2 family protein
MKGKFQILKVIIGVALLALLFYKIDIVKSLSFFSQLNFYSIAAILLMTVMLISVSVIKWQIFLNSFDLYNSFWCLFRIYIIGYFFNNFLPSNIGGDGVRITLTAREKGAYTSSFVAVFMERFTGILATLIFVGFSLPLLIWQFDFTQSAVLVLLPASTVLVVLLVIVFIRSRHIEQYAPQSVFMKKIYKKITDVLILIHSFKDQKQLLAKAMFLSVLFNFTVILNVYVVVYVLGFHVDFFHLVILVPVILLIGIIPLSINSIGIAEGAYVLCLGMAGLSPPEALAVALLIRAKTFVVSIVGGFLFLGYRNYSGAVS